MGLVGLDEHGEGGWSDLRQHGGSLLSEDEAWAIVSTLVVIENCQQGREIIDEHIYCFNDALDVLVLHHGSHSLDGLDDSLHLLELLPLVLGAGAAILI